MSFLAIQEHFSETLKQKSCYVAQNVKQGPSEYERITLMPNKLLFPCLVARVCSSLRIFL